MDEKREFVLPVTVTEGGSGVMRLVADLQAASVDPDRFCSWGERP